VSEVGVPRAAVEQLNRGVRWLVVMVVAFGLLFAWDTWQDQRVDDHQNATDAELHTTTAKLAMLEAAEAVEEEIEQADRCVESHVRYGGLKELLRRIGERTDMSDDEVAGLLEGYAAPTCDLPAAQAVLARP